MRKFILLAFILACLGGACSCIRSRSIRFDKAKQVLLERSTHIHLGDSLESVKKLLLFNNSDLAMKDWGVMEGVESDVQEVRFSTPLQFGAKNWVLVMYFQGRKVSARGFRTNDSDFEKPIGTPEDQFTPSIADIWHTRMTLVNSH